TILLDNLPNNNIDYAAVSVGGFVNVTNSVQVYAFIFNNTLSVLTSSTVILGTSSSFQVSFTATPSAGGFFANPRSGGVAKVDPANVVIESDKTNNTASDNVTVTGPPVFTSAAAAAFTVGASSLFTVRASRL